MLFKVPLTKSSYVVAVSSEGLREYVIIESTAENCVTMVRDDPMAAVL